MPNSSFRLERKARILLKKGRVKKEIETRRRIHFLVIGETDEHYVSFDKEKGKWSCDCKYSSLKERECSHIIACKLFLKEKSSL